MPPKRKSKSTDTASTTNTGTTASTTPIKVALLWHQHQPYYRAGNKFILPWVWLHATKDYLEMARHFEQVPAMRGTINLVPSLIKQIEEYLDGSGSDPVLEVMHKPTAKLTEKEKRFMRENFFHAHPQRMIFRSERYHELYDLSHKEDKELDEAYYRDLAVHYALAWTGEFSRAKEPARALIEKDRNYTEAERTALLTFLREEVAQIIPLHRTLSERGQIEISTTPFYHPILPLLCDTDAALHSSPSITLPLKRFSYPEEAAIQLERAMTFTKERFGAAPKGLWPSEGSISEEALKLTRSAGFGWAASDEAVLFNSLPVAERDDSLAKYFPRKLKTPAGDLVLFFRDHGLSDNIGFTYQSWKAEDAAKDFVSHLLNIRNEILSQKGETALAHACISVILDGENCWEYYEANGYEFLKQLYRLLSSTPEIAPVRFSEAIETIGEANIGYLDQIQPGSWINANFNIWIGHPEDNAAWDAVVHAKRAIDSYREKLVLLTGEAKEQATNKLALAHEELLIAEGSDWCWWYGDDHHSIQKKEFDELFRMHLRAVYVHLDLRVPQELSIPILGRSDLQTLYGPKKEIAPIERSVQEIAVSGLYEDESWQPATKLDLRNVFGAMHKTSKSPVSEVAYAVHDGELFLRLVLKKTLRENEKIQFCFEVPNALLCTVTRTSVSLETKSTASTALRVEAIAHETCDIALPIAFFEGQASVQLYCTVYDQKGKALRAPETGSYSLVLSS